MPPSSEEEHGLTWIAMHAQVRACIACSLPAHGGEPSLHASGAWGVQRRLPDESRISTHPPAPAWVHPIRVQRHRVLSTTIPGAHRISRGQHRPELGVARVPFGHGRKVPSDRHSIPGGHLLASATPPWGHHHEGGRS